MVSELYTHPSGLCVRCPLPSCSLRPLASSPGNSASLPPGNLLFKRPWESFVEVLSSPQPGSS